MTGEQGGGDKENFNRIMEGLGEVLDIVEGKLEPARVYTAEKATVKLVSSNTGVELETRRARDRVESALVDLAANIIRVVRGAGRPGDIQEQATAFVQASEAYRDVSGRLPSSEDLSSVLSLRSREEVVQGVNDREAAWHFSEQVMVRGALQMAASSLLGQLTQRASGHHELFQGLFEIERMRDENRREHDRAVRASKAAALKARSKSKRAPKKRPS